MKLFYDASYFISCPSGFGIYTTSLLNALLSLDRTIAVECGITSVNPRMHICLSKALKSYCPGRQIRLRHRFFPKCTPHCIRNFLSFRSEEYDVMHFTGSICPPWIPVSSLKNAVITVHDMYRFYEKPTLLEKRFRNEACRQYRECAAILANSRYTKNEILKFLPGFPEEKIEVVPLAAQLMDYAKPQSGDFLLKNNLSRYFLSVGALQYKNHDKLIRAFQKFRQTSDYKKGDKLVIAGRNAGGTDDLKQTLEDIVRKDDDIVRLDALSGNDLLCLYRNALGFFLISPQEGFGLPLLEAMTCGTPACYNPGSAMDEIGRNAAFAVSCDDEEGLLRQFAVFSEGGPEVKARVRHALEISKEYSWRRTALETLKVYQKVMGRKQ